MTVNERATPTTKRAEDSTLAKCDHHYKCRISFDFARTCVETGPFPRPCSCATQLADGTRATTATKQAVKKEEAR